jgi:hypothetical protein
MTNQSPEVQNVGTRSTSASRKLKTDEPDEEKRKSGGFFLQKFLQTPETSKTERDLQTERQKTILATESGDQGALHEIYAGMFRNWIKAGFFTQQK